MGRGKQPWVVAELQQCQTSTRYTLSRSNVEECIERAWCPTHSHSAFLLEATRDSTKRGAYPKGNNASTQTRVRAASLRRDLVQWQLDRMSVLWLWGLTTCSTGAREAEIASLPSASFAPGQHGRWALVDTPNAHC